MDHCGLFWVIAGHCGSFLTLVNTVGHLIRNRTDAGVHSQNNYLFARMYMDSLGHFDGWKAVNNIAKSASLKEPHLISSTRIEKELATTLQGLNMHDGELTWLSNHLGHSNTVDKTWYRQEEPTKLLIYQHKVGHYYLSFNVCRAKMLLFTFKSTALKSPKRITHLICSTHGKSAQTLVGLGVCNAIKQAGSAF